MTTVIGFGEVMLRLSPPGFQRLTQAENLIVTYGGAECNALVALSQFGMKTQFVTRLPANDLGDACQNAVRRYGVGLDYTQRGGDRLGVYFYEPGVAGRNGQVIYDRTGSSFATLGPGMINWDLVLDDADWFLWTGITPAISESAAGACLEAVKVARDKGLRIIADLNYRSKLWQWGKAPDQVMPELVELCDIFIVNKESLGLAFGIDLPTVDTTADELAEDKMAFDALSERFPNLKMIASTFRESVATDHHRLSAMLWNEGHIYQTRVYDINPVVDRIGGGDSFMAGLIYGLDAYDGVQPALEFAVAASCIKHTIPGDFNATTVDEVEALAQGESSGRVSR